MPSVRSRVSRISRSGSITSSRYPPTWGLRRSSSMASLIRTAVCVSPRRTTKYASFTPRRG